ncbi:tRNA (5-methylaminomethyl-2-thiouridylate)-methyltransferase, partial [Candidatus Gastranaerophilus sp. (ex Termes propinquus)]
RSETFSNTLHAGQMNWIAYEVPPKSFEASAKHRSTQSAQECLVEVLSEDEIKITFSEPQSSITKGQSVVLYDGDIVLGGGVICS